MSPLAPPRPLKGREDPSEPSLALRLALRDWFRLVRESAEPILRPDASECKASYAAVLTAWRDLSPEVAHHLYQEARAAYEATSGLCAACGNGLKGGDQPHV